MSNVLVLKINYRRLWTNKLFSYKKVHVVNKLRKLYLLSTELHNKLMKGLVRSHAWMCRRVVYPVKARGKNNFFPC